MDNSNSSDIEVGSDVLHVVGGRCISLLKNASAILHLELYSRQRDHVNISFILLVIAI
jgi:hypothetical protein